MENKNRIQNAINNTKTAAPGYFEKTLAQRAGLDKMACGSVYEGVTASELEQKLLSLEWETYTHPAIQSGSSAFKAGMPGRLGVIELATMPADTKVTLDDRKNTGTVSAVVEGIRGPQVDFTILILGMEKGIEVVFTFHPGEPVSPSKVQASPGMHGKKVTVAEALALGLKTAKIA